VPAAERYLITDEETDESGKKTVRYCLKCCEEKGLIGYRHEKDEKVLTFFPPDEKPAVARPAETVEETEETGPAGEKKSVIP
jgi:hypothetical protein